MNDRSGPFDCLEIFTTTTIVRSNTSARKIRVTGLLLAYKNIIFIDLLCIVKFGIDIMYVIDRIKIIGNRIGLTDIMICWFGVMATK